MKWDRSPGQSRWARLYLQQAELSSGSGTRAAVGGHLAGDLLVSGRACLLVSPSFLAEDCRLSVFLVDMVNKGEVDLNVFSHLRPFHPNCSANAVSTVGERTRWSCACTGIYRLLLLLQALIAFYFILFIFLSRLCR